MCVRRVIKSASARVRAIRAVDVTVIVLLPVGVRGAKALAALFGRARCLHWLNNGIPASARSACLTPPPALQRATLSAVPESGGPPWQPPEFRVRRVPAARRGGGPHAGPNAPRPAAYTNPLTLPPEILKWLGLSSHALKGPFWGTASAPRGQMNPASDNLPSVPVLGGTQNARNRLLATPGEDRWSLSTNASLRVSPAPCRPRSSSCPPASGRVGNTMWMRGFPHTHAFMCHAAIQVESKASPWGGGLPGKALQGTHIPPGRAIQEGRQ